MTAVLLPLGFPRGSHEHNALSGSFCAVFSFCLVFVFFGFGFWVLGFWVLGFCGWLLGTCFAVARHDKRRVSRWPVFIPLNFVVFILFISIPHGCACSDGLRSQLPAALAAYKKCRLSCTGEPRSLRVNLPWHGL